MQANANSTSRTGRRVRSCCQQFCRFLVVIAQGVRQSRRRSEKEARAQRCWNWPMGHRLGLCEPPSVAGGCTSDELARQTGTHERYVRETEAISLAFVTALQVLLPRQ